MSEGGTPEVRVRLVLDSNAQDLTEQIAASLKGIETHAKHQGGEIGKALGEGAHKGVEASEFFKGEIWLEAFHKFAEYGKEAIMAPFEAFAESEHAVRSMTNQLMLLSSSNAGFEQTHALASQLKEDFQDVAMASGESEEAILSAFNSVISRGEMGVEAAEKLTESMAYAGRAVPGGVEGLGQAFSAIEMGMIRPRNAIVQMIAATHGLKGNAKAVAKEMQKMTPEKQMEVANKAVEKMGEKMKQQPMTIDQMSKSMATFKTKLLEGAGEGIFEKFTAMKAKGRGRFFEDDGKMTELGESLVKYSKKAGEVLGKAFDLGAEFVVGFGEGLSMFSEEFKIIWGEVFGKGDSSFETWKSIMHTVGGSFGVVVKSFGAGIGAIIVLLEKTVKWMTITLGRTIEDIGDGLGNETLKKAGKSTRDAGFSSERKGITADYVNVDKGINGREFMERYMATTMGTEAEREEGMAQLEAAGVEYNKRRNKIAEAEIETNRHNASGFVDVFNSADEMHDEAVNRHIAFFVAGNKEMQDALMKEGPEIFGKGIDAFIDALKEAGGADFAAKFKSIKSLDKTGINVNNNFSGGITVKQDFKDQDPDRVAIQFVKKMGDLGTSMLQARTSTPFGV